MRLGRCPKEGMMLTLAGFRLEGRVAVLADVSDDDAVRGLVARAVEAFGGVDIAVSNVSVRPHRAFLDIAPEEWDRVLRTNLSSAFFLARHALPHMLSKGKGRVIHISGVDGFFGNVTHRAHNVVAK